MGTRLCVVLALLLTGGLLAGCGPDGGTATSASPSPSASEPSASAGPGPGNASGEPAPTATAPAQPPAGSSAATSDISVTGQVEQGVEAGCLLLRTDGKSYLLVGGDRNILKAGSTVTVRGHVITGTMSHCMQGQPFQVSEARLG
jgi:hypothetical protein